MFSPGGWGDGPSEGRGEGSGGTAQYNVSCIMYIHPREWGRVLTSGEGGSGVGGRGGGEDREGVPGADSCEWSIWGESGSR